MSPFKRVLSRVAHRHGVRVTGANKRPRPSSAGSRTTKRVRSGSRTAVARKKKLENPVKETRGGSESHWTKITNKLPRAARGLVKGTLTKVSLIRDNHFELVTNPATQGFGNIYQLFSVNDINAMMAQAILQQYGSSTPTGYRTDRIMLLSAQAEYQYMNGTNASCRLVIFDAIPRRDLYNRGGTPEDPVFCIQQGISDQISGGSSTEYVKPGYTPFDSAMFTSLWKVLKITHVDLGPGQTHYHRLNFKPMRIISNEVLQAAPNFLKGFTTANFVQLLGGVAKGSDGTSTLSAAELLTVQRVSYKYTYLPNNLNSNPVATNGLIATLSANPIENVMVGAAQAFQSLT